MASSSPGRWVVYFSLAALPLFGIGQVLLPGDAAGSRRLGLAFLVVYMAAALGLLITTSFLGLRRYLRQRYLRMPASIAFAWVKFGGGIACSSWLARCLFRAREPTRSGARSGARRITGCGRPANTPPARNPHGEGEGRAGNETGATKNEKQADGNSGPPEKSASGTPQPGQGPGWSQTKSAARWTPPRTFIRCCGSALLAGAALIACWWLVRCRHLLFEMLRSGAAAVRDFFRRLLDLVPARKPFQAGRPAGAPPSAASAGRIQEPVFCRQGARPPAG